MAKSIRDRFRVPDSDDFSVVRIGTKPDPDVDRKDLDRRAKKDRERLARRQEQLWAEHRRSLLIVLQGMDASGKDGAIKHVIGAMNPQGCRVTSFKQPTEQERAHDFLWRIRRALPKPAEVGVFNRSHYEDVVIARVDNLVSEETWRHRYGIINKFEKELSRRDIVTVKIFLHISLEEQRRRLLRRLEKPDKRWKFDPGDIEKRKQWDEYMEAYTDAMVRCSTDLAPWYVIPADAKWYRNWVLGRILLETFAEMAPEYPQPEIDVEGFEKALGSD